MIAITFALPAESARFLRHLRERSRQKHNGITIVAGKIDRLSVEVLHTGVGERVCRQRLARFLQNRQFDYLISAGFAGALTDELRVGDLVLAKNFSTVELARVRSALAGWPVHLADLYTAPVMIFSAGERASLAEKTGTAAVDMETKFIARACAEHALPHISLRVISDSPAESLPAPPDVLFNVERQRTELPKLAAFLMAHPIGVPKLIRFTNRIARARKSLADALVAVVKLEQ